MKTTLHALCLFFAFTLLMVSCKEKEPKEDAIFDPRYPETPQITKQANDKLSEADFIFMHDNYLVELYVQDSTNKVMKKVPDFDHLPKGVMATYNLIRDKNGNVMYVAEFPYSASGDWENIYESIFDESGNLLLFVRKSSFIFGQAVVAEKSQYFYNTDHKLVKKTYDLKDGQENPIPDGTSVDFPYRFSYEKYKTRKDWLAAHNLDK
ncbi:MAG: hypothetical protein P4L28_02850 [Paludibacteraceae bacterium]|nr:hypothetical protein [Paludibacteraceae bacterium]